MTPIVGFDNAKYIELQSQRIRERIEEFGGRLYMEFGGKLYDDFHAARVLPGFEPDSKLKMLLTFENDAEIIFSICADDIEKRKQRDDLGIRYDEEVLRLIDAYRDSGLNVSSVVITMYNGQPSADAFRARLGGSGIKTYLHYPIEGYPADTARVISEEGFGKNDWVETTKSLVVVTGPGPGSGKLATCLSQVYNDNRHGIKAGYAKFETFPVWDLAIDHPINYAYEAATTDLDDENQPDFFHKAAYGVDAVNYNRDLEAFPVLKRLFEEIWGECPYKSPTDMGVNVLGQCITDDDVCRAAARREILRRWYVARTDFRKGKVQNDTIAKKNEAIVKKAGVSDADNPAIAAARNKADATRAPAAALLLPNGNLVSSKTSNLLGAASALLLNSLKNCAGIERGINLIPPEVLTPVTELKTTWLGHKNPRLHCDEALVALSISASTDDNAKKALEQLPNLRGSEAFFTVIPSAVDEKMYKRLGINFCCEPEYESSKLYHK